MAWKLRTPHEREIQLAEGVHVLGRGEACEILTPETDLSVSRRHATLSVAGARLEIEDAGSANGTFVEGRAIRARAPLQPGDTVQVGESRFRVGWDGGAPPAAGAVGAPNPLEAAAVEADHRDPAAAGPVDAPPSDGARVPGPWLPSEGAQEPVFDCRPVLARYGLLYGKACAVALLLSLFLPWLRALWFSLSYAGLLAEAQSSRLLMLLGGAPLLAPALAAAAAVAGIVLARRGWGYPCFAAAGALGLLGAAALLARLSAPGLLWFGLERGLGAGFYLFTAASALLLLIGGAGTAAGRLRPGWDALSRTYRRWTHDRTRD